MHRSPRLFAASRTRRVHSSLFLSSVFLAAAFPSRAVDYSDWATGSGDWAVAGNWQPAGVPDQTRTARIGFLNAAVGATIRLAPGTATSMRVEGLILVNGVELKTNGNQLDASGLISVENNSQLTLEANELAQNQAVDGNRVTLKTGGRMVLNKATLSLLNEIRVEQGSTLSGEGLVSAGALAIGSQALYLNGTIRVTGGTLRLKAERLSSFYFGTGVVQHPMLQAENTEGPATDFLTLIVDGQISSGGTSTRLRIGQNDTITFLQPVDFLLSEAFMAGGTGTATLNGAGKVTYNSSQLHIAGACVIGNDVDFKNTTVFDMAPGAVLTLRGAVSLDADSSFTGDGSETSRLVIDAGAVLTPKKNVFVPEMPVNIGVPVENRGVFRVDAAEFREATVRAFTQTATGELRCKTGGTAPAMHDRVISSTTASLGGALRMEMANQYAPSFGDEYVILTAPGGVSGKFSGVVQPAELQAGLAFKVNYLADSVVVRVGTVSAYDVWMKGITGLTDGLARLPGADPDGDGLINFGEFALNGNPATGVEDGRRDVRAMAVAGGVACVYTIPVRAGAVGPPAGEPLVLQQVADGLRYSVQASQDAGNWNLTVSELTGATAVEVQAGLPALDLGWEYRSFSASAGPGTKRVYMRVAVDELGAE